MAPISLQIHALIPRNLRDLFQLGRSSLVRVEVIGAGPRFELPVVAGSLMQSGPRQDMTRALIWRLGSLEHFSFVSFVKAVVSPCAEGSQTDRTWATARGQWRNPFSAQF